MPDGPGGWGLPSRNIENPSGGSTDYGAVLREFHVPWPACNQDAARQAADAWNALAVGIDDIAADCTNMVNSITTNNSGQAIDAFATNWQKYGGTNGALTLSSGACRALAKACNEYADKVSEVKSDIEFKAEELVAITVAAAAALIFSFGVSALVEAGVAEDVVAWATGLMDDIATTVSYTSGQLAEDIGFLTAPVSATAGATITGIAGGVTAGTFAAMFDEEFEGTLSALKNEPLPSAIESINGVKDDAATGALLAVLAEATPAAAGKLTTDKSIDQAVSISPQLSLILDESSKLAAWLDTAAGKAFIEAGGIEALKKAGWLDETATEGKFIEAMLEGPLSKLNPGAGE